MKKIVITKLERYLSKEEAQVLNRYLSTKPGIYNLRKITKEAYLFEIKSIQPKEKAELKEDLNQIGLQIYKTEDTWKTLKERQEERESKEAPKLAQA